MSRPHRNMRTLASLEVDRYQRQTNQRPRLLPAQERAESEKAPASSIDYPLHVFPAFQWKYNVDEKSPWWKRIYFRFLWLPFARFSYFKMKIIPFERLEPDGSLSWKEQQGVFTRERDAQREASKYKYGGYSEVRFNAPEPAKTVIGRTHFADSDAYVQYERAIMREAENERSQFKQVLDESQQVVDRFRSRATHA